MSGESSGNTASINGIELYYETEGCGDPLLLLHGGGGCQEHWVHAGGGQLAREYKLIKPSHVAMAAPAIQQEPSATANAQPTCWRCSITSASIAAGP